MECSNIRSKIRGKFRLFQCFKHDDVVSPRSKMKTTDPLLTYIAVAEKQGIVLPTILSEAFAMAKGNAGEGSKPRRKKIGRDNSIRRTLITAFNNSTLAKKIFYNRKKNKNNVSRSRVSNIHGGEKISNTESKITSGTNSNTSSSSLAFTPSWLSSSTFSSSTSTGTEVSGSSLELYPSRSLSINGIGVMEQKQIIEDNRKENFGSNMGLCLLFITSLWVLIMWGKLCAIVCTSIGFFVLPNR